MPTFISQLKKKDASRLLLLLLCLDFSLLLLQILGRTPGRNYPGWVVHGFWLVMEFYQIAKMSLVAILFARAARAMRCAAYFTWMLAFVYLLVDETLLLHQRLGDWLARHLDALLVQSLGLRPRLVEVAILVIVVIVFSVIIGRAYMRGPQEFRRVSKDMLLLVALWALFGFLKDVAGAIRPNGRLEFAAGFIEDGGEMVVVSLILWYVFRLAYHLET